MKVYMNEVYMNEIKNESLHEWNKEWKKNIYESLGWNEK